MLHLFIVYLFTLGLFNVDLNCLIYVASDYSLINEQHNRPSSFNFPSHVPFVDFLVQIGDYMGCLGFSSGTWTFCQDETGGV
jgi:hypothetical protein